VQSLLFNVSFLFNIIKYIQFVLKNKIFLPGVPLTSLFKIFTHFHKKLDFSNFFAEHIM
jgi:hypothetical protein